MKLGVPSVRPRQTFDRALSQRLAAVTALRLLIVTLLLSASAFFYLRGDLAAYPQSLRILFATIAASYALGAAYALALRSGARLDTIAYAQIALDQITWTAIAYVTGGATSGAASFYGVTCLVGALLLGQRGAIVGAACAIVMYFALCGALSRHLITPPHDQPAAAYATTRAELVYPMLQATLSILFASFGGAYLAERLRIAGGALEDIRQRMQASERLALLGRVAAGLAHEIRNPLGSISGSIEMLRESQGLTEEDKQLCAIIQREAARLNQLVTDMLDLSKPREPRLEIVDVASLAREVVALAAGSERSGSGDVRVAYDGPIEPAYARCDGAQIRQVLWNLVRNAVQASGAGSTVRVRVTPTPSGVELAVEDHGPGIAESQQERIFDAFFTTRSHGAGIGLAVVKRIIDDHAPYGASIAIESPRTPRGGATFRVRLPQASAPSG